MVLGRGFNEAALQGHTERGLDTTPCCRSHVQPCRDHCNLGKLLHKVHLLFS